MNKCKTSEKSHHSRNGANHNNMEHHKLPVMTGKILTPMIIIGVVNSSGINSKTLVAVEAEVVVNEAVEEHHQ